jgi:hypothetical protein
MALRLRRHYRVVSGSAFLTLTTREFRIGDANAFERHQRGARLLLILALPSRSVLTLLGGYVFTRELRLIDQAITEILSGEYYNADQAEIEDFCNQIRHILEDRGVRIEDGGYQQTVVNYPAELVLTAKPNVGGSIANAKRKGKTSPKLSASDVEYIRDNPEGLSAVAMALKFNVSDATIHGVVVARHIWTFKINGGTRQMTLDFRNLRPRPDEWKAILAILVEIQTRQLTEERVEKMKWKWSERLPLKTMPYPR